MPPPRTKPNIIITGTPGVGKSSHAELLASETGLTHLSINDIVKTAKCHDGYDERLQSLIVDEDKLLDEIERQVEAGGNIIDWHVCDIFPKRWIDLVVVLRAETEGLYDRLLARGYAEDKVTENMDSEIMEVVLQEAREGYDEGVVVELRSDKVEDMDGNVQRIVEWVEKWEADHPEGV